MTQLQRKLAALTEKLLLLLRKDEEEEGFDEFFGHSELSFYSWKYEKSRC